MKMIEILKEEMKNALKIENKQTNKKLEQINKFIKECQKCQGLGVGDR